jgi:RNA polymerase sigma factor (sigma-70 family)
LLDAMTSPQFETVLTEQIGPLTRRAARMVGDAQTAEDLRQETLARAWRSAPRDLPAGALRAWLHRTTSNLALDELRRRRRRGELALGDAGLPAAQTEPGDRTARDALAALTAHERLVLLLRHEAGLSLREVGDVLDISEEAARKRVARARTAFSAELERLRAEDRRPTVALLMGGPSSDAADPYVAWLERAGARVRIIRRDSVGLDLAGADALVLSGSTADIDPRLYRQARSPRLGPVDLHRDLRDLQALRAALRSDLPVVGICRGAQLLNVLHGGDLHQDMDEAGLDARGHRMESHGVHTGEGTVVRRALGRTDTVVSWHHQAVRRVGTGVRVSARAADGLPEAVEVPGRRFALGLQWHPELGERPGDARVAETLVEAACAA